MPRLIDDIRAAKHLQAPFFVGPRKADAWSEHASVIADMLRAPGNELPVILIDNVADYYYTASDQEYWDIGRDFPNLAPPFPVAWYEHRLPGTIHSKELGDTDVTKMITRGRSGVLVRAVKPEDAKGEGALPEGTAWILWCELFIDYGWRGRPIEGPHGAMFLCIDSEGHLLERPWMQSYAEPRWAEEMKSLMTWLHPTLLAVTFLHCKNVRIEDNQVPKPLAKKYRERHGGVNPTSYKTLIIEPLKQILRHEGNSDKVGIAKAMHICRGHFRDYREGRGLFGKYKQLVWTPMTVRGTKGKSAPTREIVVKV